ncbi:GMC oxidoreductase [Streptomyces sp. NPDC055025]
MRQNSHAGNQGDAEYDAGNGAGHDAEYDYDVIVVGSGFGGSVSALRLTEKGYRVGVLEVHLKAAAEAMGVGDSFHPAPVGVFFGDGEDADGTARAEPGAAVGDPYFGGAGPSRTACTECGACMTGCRHGAKNTLDENYLYLAERAGAVIHPMTSVIAVEEETDTGERAEAKAAEKAGGFRVTTVPTDARRWGRRRGRRGRDRTAYSKQTLLHTMRDRGLLPRVSARLGELTRTNSEALVGAQTGDRRYRARHGAARADFTRGVAITSSVHPNASTHIEPVRYGKGSNAMGALSIVQVPVSDRRVRAWLGNAARHPLWLLRSLSNRRWSERTIIGLVMQSHDNSLTTYRRPGGPGKGLLTARQGHGAPNPEQIPEATRAATLIAEEINGFAGSNVGELLGTPLTAHFLGGCVIGASAREGVIDPYHRLYGHPGISVVDGSAVSANPGVNPSLTITAQAERAMFFWPNKGEPDPRPEQGTGAGTGAGAAYARPHPVEPVSPAVPAEAFGALRLPFLGIPAVPPKRI